jgi:hypothetical protein
MPLYLFNLNYSEQVVVNTNKNNNVFGRFKFL